MKNERTRVLELYTCTKSYININLYEKLGYKTRPCGFHIVEFYNDHYPDPNDSCGEEDTDNQFPDGMFRFEKRMR